MRKGFTVKNVAIHGLGYLGATNFSYLVGKYITCTAYDYAAKEGKPPRVPPVVSSYFENLHLSKNLLIDKQTLGKIARSKEEFYAAKANIHLICLPSESSGIPNLEYIKTAAADLSMHIQKGDQTLILVESTLYPQMIDDVFLSALKDRELSLDEDFFLGAVVRQDRIRNEFDYGRQPARVISAPSQVSLQKTAEFYSETNQPYLVCNDYRSLELVKHVENALTQIQQSLANQIAIAYQTIDTAELFRTINAHMQTDIWPNLGIGGFAAPMSTRILLDHAPDEEVLSVLKESILTDLAMQNYILEDIGQKKIRNVLILGVSSEKDSKQHIFSPFIRLAGFLRKNGINAYGYDPFFPQKDLLAQFDLPALESPYELDRIEGVIVGSHHSWLDLLECDRFLESTKHITYFLDNGCFNRYRHHIPGYKLIGEKNWLGDSYR